MLARQGLLQLQKQYGNFMTSIHTCHVALLKLQVKVKEKPRRYRRKWIQTAHPNKSHQIKVGPPVVECRNEKLNHYKSLTYGKFDVVPLASNGWLHRKSKGDYFVIHGHSQMMAKVEQPLSFLDLGLTEDIVNILQRSGITQPSHIQECGVPMLLSRRNVVLAAETGCGKTLTYLLPIIQHITRQQQTSSSFTQDDMFNTPLAVVVTPSRELALQIGEMANDFSRKLLFSCKTIIGGRTKKKIFNPTFEKVDLLVASLGALSKLTSTGVYKMKRVRHIVLDEADTLLDDSFNEKLCHFLRRFPLQVNEGVNEHRTQLTLVSATLPTSIPDILGDIIVPESLTRVTTGQLHKILPHVPQKFIRLGLSQKPSELLKLVKADVDNNVPVIVFSNKSSTCDWVSMFLNENGVKCVNLNGDMPLGIRRGVFKSFQQGHVHVISCTDVGSRGLDTVRVKHVINYEFPLYMADYIHRSGRTGRVGSRDGCHVTSLVSGKLDVKLVQQIELAARTAQVLPNVNGNIRRVIEARAHKRTSLQPGIPPP